MCPSEVRAWKWTSGGVLEEFFVEGVCNFLATKGYMEKANFSVDTGSLKKRSVNAPFTAQCVIIFKSDLMIQISKFTTNLKF